MWPKIVLRWVNLVGLKNYLPGSYFLRVAVSCPYRVRTNFYFGDPLQNCRTKKFKGVFYYAKHILHFWGSNYLVTPDHYSHHQPPIIKIKREHLNWKRLEIDSINLFCTILINIVQLGLGLTLTLKSLSTNTTTHSKIFGWC